MPTQKRGPAPLYKVRQSRIHGRGVFAARKIRKGTRVIEYLGERVSHAEADRRYEDKARDDNHTFLFVVDRRTVIDAGVDGNEARWINHSCDPNCESQITRGRVWIVSLRKIKAGEELTYDYYYDYDHYHEHPCRCGAEDCAGFIVKAPQRWRVRHARKKGKLRRKKTASPQGFLSKAA